MKPLEARILSAGIKSLRMTANIDSSKESDWKIQLLDDDYNGDVKVLYGRKHCSTVQEVMDDAQKILDGRAWKERMKKDEEESRAYWSGRVAR